MRRLALTVHTLALLILLIGPALHGQDTTYTLGPDLGSTVGLYPHYYQLARSGTVIGVVLQGNAQAGSCANVWCALVPGSSGGYSQSGGTFLSLSAAAQEVVRVWNLSHPSPLPVPAPVVTSDTVVTFTRIACPSASPAWLTCYTAATATRGVIGKVFQDLSHHWWPFVGSAPTPLSPYSLTRGLAGQRIVAILTTGPTPVPPADTVIIVRHDTVTRVDTVTVTRVDTVTILRVDTVQVRLAPGEPELPRYRAQMDAMVESARAADTVTRQVFDLVGQSLVPRLDSLHRAVCNRIVRTGTTEQPEYFPCPPGVVELVRLRTEAYKAAEAKARSTPKAKPVPPTKFVNPVF